MQRRRDSRPGPGCTARAASRPRCAALASACAGILLLMALIDKAAAIAATRHCRTNVVTASVDSLTFRAPVRLGHILMMYASVNASFRTSMEVGVKVLSEDPLSGLRAHCCSAYVTMVALDALGRPTPVPGLLPGTPEERRRRREAAQRRRGRLSLRSRKDRPRARRR